MNATTFVLLGLVTIAAIVAAIRWKGRTTPAPVTIAILLAVLFIGAWAWDADRASRDRDANAAAEDARRAAQIAADQLYLVQVDNYQLELGAYTACNNRVESRETLGAMFARTNTSFDTLYSLLELAAGQGVEQFRSLIEAGRADVEANRQFQADNYPPLPPNTCPANPPDPPTAPAPITVPED